MGAWGAGIFDNDLALDARHAFEDALEAGSDVATASRNVLETFADVLDDEDDGPTIYLALAALQVEHGAIEPAVRVAALDVIASGQDLARWDEDIVEQRRQILDELWRRLSVP